MKKIIAIAICVFMLVSTLSICAFAEWTPVGTVEATYDNTLADKITWDGRIDDWEASGVPTKVLNSLSMIPWEGTVNEDFEITLYFAADKTNFYIAFWVVDKTPGTVPEAAVTSMPTEGEPNMLDGDHFQIQLDIGKTLTATQSFDRAVYYSFARREDGNMLLEANADEGGRSATPGFDLCVWADEAGGNVGVHGGCAELADGWSAELAIPWQLIYDHMYYKCIKNYEDDIAANLEITFGPDNALESSANVCYVNVDTDNEDNTYSGTHLWAAGTPDHENDASTGELWYPDHSGIIISVEPDEVISITDTSDHAKAKNTNGGNEGETEAPTTAPGGDNETEAPTTAPGGDNETEAPTTAPSNETTPTEEGGCGSVVGFGSVAVIALAIGTVAFKKKED